MNYNEAWRNKKFVDFLRLRLGDVGVPASETGLYTGHSLKRGGVQVMRSLGVKDLSIMKWFGMTGQSSYLRYTELCNAMAIEGVPDFCSSSYQPSHVRARADREQPFYDDPFESVVEWIRNGLSVMTDTPLLSLISLFNGTR